MTIRKPVFNFIGGEWRPPETGTYLEDADPATGQTITQIPRSGADDVANAVKAARSAFETWSNVSMVERAELLEAVAGRIEARMKELAKLESIDTGKPYDLAMRLDIPRAVSNFRFFAQAIRQTSTGFHEMPGAINYTLRQPIGIAGLITPWNLPLYLLSWKMAPALAMGNTIVAKPSELTPLTADALAQIFEELKAPPGIFNLIHGYGHEAGQALVEHPEIGLISFTGGTVTGKKVATTAAPMFKKLSLELGGKNPTLVFADRFTPETVKGVARSAFLNQGQICLCGSRILVERSIHDRFTEELAREIKTWKIGPPQNEGVQFGALISHDHLAKIERYVQMARELGGRIVTGGQRAKLPAPYDRGAFYEPTIITGLSSGCEPATEEIFGPVITVHPFDNEAQAVTMANEVRYGLSASVWTSDLDRAHRVSRKIEAGTVWVNTWLMRDLRVPFGGMKDSGVGREGGEHSLEFFSESKNVCIQLGAF
ncbi:MAG TPA: aldehyde dehydrogenase [Bdellovibrionales bacterium]|nr:aldehyde dehydrogenase [Bdellovibrionales bacterium]